MMNAETLPSHKVISRNNSDSNRTNKEKSMISLFHHTLGVKRKSRSIRKSMLRNKKRRKLRGDNGAKKADRLRLPSISLKKKKKGPVRNRNRAVMWLR